MNKDDLLKRLTILDFLAVDLQLYLDTHPKDESTINKYNSIISEGDALRAQYEELYGPLYSFRSPSANNNFNWTDCPWPWQRDFNFSFEKEED